MFGGSYFDKEITKAQYDRAMKNRGYLTDADEEKVLTVAQRCGYGATAGRVRIENGKYLVSCHIYNHCD